MAYGVAEIRRIEVRGTVQGVGFRPFVYRLATSLGVRGGVRNAGGLVVITAAGTEKVLDEFTARLVAEAPACSAVTGVAMTRLAGAALGEGFTVLPSTPLATTPRELPPDLATCAECLAELFDPDDRRYRYPFINCVNCGPRATIIADLPYGRENTTMRSFAPCADCAAEYRASADRRFHAEPIACPVCGPRLSWLCPPGTPDGGSGSDGQVSVGRNGPDALDAAVAVIDAGGVVAVKGIGGYQLICDATQTGAVTRLRAAKRREGTPLAVMVADLVAAGALARLTVADVGLLTSAARPIVLLPHRPAHTLAPGVCDGLPDIGLFLPYSPLHHLLLDALARPLVVTSGNLAGGPILIDDADAGLILGPATDGILTHDRPILSRYDDSVVASVGAWPVMVRRARGYAPAPLPLPAPAPEPLLAVGAQVNHAFTIAIGGHAITGPPTGDLENADTLEAFGESLDRLRRLQDADPAYVAHDLHPGYLSTRYARRWPTGRRIAVQHHHAHVAATAAEHGLAGPFLGVAYDGLGLGEDGTFWGGEVLLASYTGYRRLGRFSRAPMPGGAAAVRRPARMALGYLYGAERLGDPGPDDAHADDLLARLPRREATVVRRMVERGVNAPYTSSAGRLFDAVAALLGICDDNHFAGEAALRLEAVAHGVVAEPLAWRVVRHDGLWVYDAAATLRDALQALADGESPGVIAAAFHETLATVTVILCEQAAADTGVATVCLSGGVFQNRRLAAAVRDGLDAVGFDAYLGERVPVNDEGISYGQAAVAAARLAGW